MNSPVKITAKGGVAFAITDEATENDYIDLWNDYADDVTEFPKKYPAPNIPDGIHMARLQWQYKPYDDKLFFINCSDDLWETTIPEAFETRQIWVLSADGETNLKTENMNNLKQEMESLLFSITMGETEEGIANDIKNKFTEYSAEMERRLLECAKSLGQPSDEYAYSVIDKLKQDTLEFLGV